MPLIIRFALVLGLMTLAVACDSSKPAGPGPAEPIEESQTPAADGGGGAADGEKPAAAADADAGGAAQAAKEGDAGAAGAAAKGAEGEKKSSAGVLPDPNFDLKAPSLKAPAGGPGLNLPGSGKKKPSLLDTKLKPGQ